MKRILSILLILLSVLVIGSCSKAEIRQAKVMTQAEIDLLSQALTLALLEELTALLDTCI